MCSASATAAALALLPDPVFACDYLDLCVYSYIYDDDDAADDMPQLWHSLYCRACNALNPA
ncbi:hypothetical protein ODQ55_23985 [Escherichia coli]|nr:hypothetical protein [Escherichia coli]